MNEPIKSSWPQTNTDFSNRDKGTKQQRQKKIKNYLRPCKSVEATLREDSLRVAKCRFLDKISPYPQYVIHNSQRERGFTLIEILAALAILSIALVVILQLFSVNLKGITTSDGYVDAVMKAESIMRNILDNEKLEEKSWSETTEDGYGIDVSITETENKRTENLMLKLMEIDLTIRWQQGTKERKLTLKTMKTVAK